MFMFISIFIFKYFYKKNVETISVTFLFDTNDLTTPPDLILEDNIGFSKECEKSDILNINTIISNWNIKDDNCIINLIQKLKDSFKVNK